MDQYPEKGIFPYWNGEAQVFGDPIALWIDLFKACDGELNTWFDATRDESQPLRAVEYATKIIAAARQVFRLQPFDTATGRGATVHDVYTVLESFFDWLKKNASGSGT